jgi:hypothetical protein
MAYNVNQNPNLEGYNEISFFIHPKDKDLVLAELRRIGINSVSSEKWFPKGMLTEAWVNKINIADIQACVNCNHLKHSHDLEQGTLLNDKPTDICWGLRADNNACKCRKFSAKP